MIDLDYDNTGKVITEHCPFCEEDITGFITEVNELMYYVAFQCSQCGETLKHKLYSKEALEEYLKYLKNLLSASLLLGFLSLESCNI